MIKLIILLIALLLPIVGAFDTLQYSADVNGRGTIYSDTDGQTSHSSSYVRDGDYATGISLNKSGQSENLFSGFALENATGYGSFKVVTKSGGLAHVVSVFHSKNLIAQTVSGTNEKKFITRYDISGVGDLREQVIGASSNGRPEYMRSAAANGSWQLNESIQAGFAPVVTNSIFNATEMRNITTAQGGA